MESYNENLSTKIKNFIDEYKTIFLYLLILILISSLISDTFFSFRNIINILGQLSTNGLLTFSLALVIILGGIDLSVGPVISSSGIILVMLLGTGLPFWMSVLLTILFGVVVGIINGLIITEFDIAPFIVTLSTSFIIQGFGRVITDGSSITAESEALYFTGHGTVFGVLPVSFVVVMLVTIFLYYLLTQTKYGTYVYAIGGNERSAIESGINVTKVKIQTYILSAVFATIAGIILAGRMYSASPRIGTGYEVEAIAAAVLGGISFSGGVGKVWGAFFGGLFMAILNSGMNSMAVEDSMQYIVKGIVLILALVYDLYTINKKEKINLSLSINN